MLVMLYYMLGDYKWCMGSDVAERWL